ncbi:bifunctional fucokinase/fucose pyrophosphorylase isoform X1 [Nymphaea colorata]|nr:bifunctional fucokinase/fucose pyrophosphorylase isoform X1 [Nymphaea colorata]
MESRRQTKGSRRKSPAMEVLRKLWYLLRLSVRHPSRVPTWDAIVLTAASPEQAHLYDWQLQRAKRMGRIASSTITLAVPDPHGARIGSGAATLNALRALASRLTQVSRAEYGFLQSFPLHDRVNDEVTDESLVLKSMVKMHILLLHAGGDSKRVPWANPMGKVFLPLPYLAADDPDGPVPLLFDHIVAVSSGAVQAFEKEGGLFIMTGDVLPCFDTSTMVLPNDASCIITVPITLDIAANHGVVVVSENEILDPATVRELKLVGDLLQKPSIQELSDKLAIRSDGRALLDTGNISVRGKAWEDLLRLSSSSDLMIEELLRSRKEMSLYEELVAAWVPSRHNWLKSRPLGTELINGLGNQRLFSYCAYDLSFLHFGTSSEVLDHLDEAHTRYVGRRHLCSIPATTVSDISASAVILSSQIDAGVSIGEDSLVYDSLLSGGVQIGSRCIVVGVHIQEEKGNESLLDVAPFTLPDRHCLWEVPLLGRSEKVIIFCGLHDNPKNSFARDGTFCGKPWKKILHDSGIQPDELWSSSSTDEMCLWNAKIFPVMPLSEMLSLAMWLMGLNGQHHEHMLSAWRTSYRVSLEQMHRSIDFKQLCMDSSNHQANIAAGIAKACIKYGLLGRNLSQLCAEILQNEKTGISTCMEFFNLCCKFLDKNSRILPLSRIYQVQVDLLKMCGGEIKANLMERSVWMAVADETAAAVKFGLEDHLLDSFTVSARDGNGRSPCQSKHFHSCKVKVELPVRVDFVGGWSDTPPWSLERSGCVLNMAILLEDSLPVGAQMETVPTGGIWISDDAANQVFIDDATSISAPFHQEDPFRLVKSALLVTGFVQSEVVPGLRIITWANVPRGSGLGTSSILAAAVVKGLLRIMNGDESNENTARLVLVLEQLMGTGGGWQDQIGGLYPGIKCTASFPGKPLKLHVIPLAASPNLVEELEQRLLVVFTGQVRLANQVLQKVVTRYLQRDSLLISSIKRLAELAKIGQEALMNGDVDELGSIMLEAWRLHQELDPYCSNSFVDNLFKSAEKFCCGYKLVGAGGGGFALLLARDKNCAMELRKLLEVSNLGVKVYNWKIHFDGSDGDNFTSFFR